MVCTRPPDVTLMPSFSPGSFGNTIDASSGAPAATCGDSAGVSAVDCAVDCASADEPPQQISPEPRLFSKNAGNSIS